MTGIERDVKELRSKISKLVITRELYQQDFKSQTKQASVAHQLSADTVQALEILQVVAKQTQENIEKHISSIVSIALASIFDEPYKFRLIYEIKRGKTEAKLVLERDGEFTDPMYGAGGGVVDVAAFALRIALHMLSSTRKVIILDEPFRFLSKDLQPKAGAMLKELSSKLGLQVIMVTHNEEFIEAADRVFEVSKTGNTSKVEMT